MSEKKIDVRALAKLARMDVSEEELQKLETELPAILDFVETIQSVDAGKVERDAELRNVTREDGEPHESGIYTERLLAQAPATKNDRIVVNQVISRRNAKR